MSRAEETSPYSVRWRFWHVIARFQATTSSAVNPAVGEVALLLPFCTKLQRQRRNFASVQPPNFWRHSQPLLMDLWKSRSSTSGDPRHKANLPSRLPLPRLANTIQRTARLKSASNLALEICLHCQSIARGARTALKMHRCSWKVSKKVSGQQRLLRWRDEGKFVYFFSPSLDSLSLSFICLL